MISAFIRGHLISNVLPCVKHFPGHGDTVLDSHFDLPKVNVSKETLYTRELIPFQKAIRSKCPLIMIAHVVYPALDPEMPATCSSKILTGILRNELGYAGVIVSDDFEMKAMTDYVGDKAPVLALQAGCDLLLYRSEGACGKGIEIVKKALQDGELDPLLILNAYQRISLVKKKSPLAKQLTSILDLKKHLQTEESQLYLQKVND
jgi:beta-N-acetylhexosaminidase